MLSCALARPLEREECEAVVPLCDVPAELERAMPARESVPFMAALDWLLDPELPVPDIELVPERAAPPPPLWFIPLMLDELPGVLPFMLPLVLPFTFPFVLPATLPFVLPFWVMVPFRVADPVCAMEPFCVMEPFELLVLPIPAEDDELFCEPDAVAPAPAPPPAPPALPPADPVPCAKTGAASNPNAHTDASSPAFNIGRTPSC
jgi:hypothetical protein